jgi:hypothetical protein
VSWIFSFLLVCYASVRLVLWMRGQWRWLSLRKGLPDLPSEVRPPEHLSANLARLFSTCRTLRIELTHARRMLALVAATDPDVPLGQVRDTRYRRALMESWTHLRAWLREAERLDELDRTTLDELGLGTRNLAELTEGLRPRWSAVARARALDPFPLDDLELVRTTLERAELELVALERGLASVPDDPYRDRFAMA